MTCPRQQRQKMLSLAAYTYLQLVGKAFNPTGVVGGKELREGAVTYSQLSPFKLSPRLAKGGGP